MAVTTPEPPLLAKAPVPKQIRPVAAKASSPVAVILLYLIVVFVGAALIAPRFYASAQFLRDVSYRFNFIADIPFHRFVSRCLILLAIVALPSLLKGLGLRSASVLGFRGGTRHIVEAFHGFGLSFVALAMLAALFLTFEVRTVDLGHSSARWTQHLKNAALSATLVAVLEELLFRGALFGALRQSFSFSRAAILSSAVYALLHFLRQPDYSGRRVEWTTGFEVLGQVLSGFTEFSVIIPAFFNYMLVGLLLALVFERSRSILFPIGLHAGLVFWLKSMNVVTHPVEGEATWFWGSEKVVDGWATGILLLLVFLLVERTIPPRKVVE
jgi:membrane protease YdiL (CAAX protease family)